MSLIDKIILAIIAVIEGMFTVLKHAFRKPITLEYPEVKDNFNSRQRGRVALRTNKDGSHFCIGCKSCVKVCPCGDLIQIETKKGEDKKLIIEKFTVDTGRCIVCGNCADICPTKAIVMIEDYEQADFSREALVLDMDKLKIDSHKSLVLFKKIEKDI